MRRHVPLLGLAVCCCACTASLVAPSDPGNEANAWHSSSNARDAAMVGASDSQRGGDPFEALRLRFGASSVRSRQQGMASYYGDSLAGNKMASGAIYDPSQPILAHRTLPFGTVVRITRVSTGAQVVLRVLDRGPFGKKSRIADLSKEAARRLGMLRDGVAEIRLEVLGRENSVAR